MWNSAFWVRSWDVDLHESCCLFNSLLNILYLFNLTHLNLLVHQGPHWKGSHVILRQIAESWMFNSTTKNIPGETSGVSAWECPLFGQSYNSSSLQKLFWACWRLTNSFFSSHSSNDGGLEFVWCWCPLLSKLVIKNSVITRFTPATTITTSSSWEGKTRTALLLSRELSIVSP